jgi:hypothetical protein
MVFWYEENEGSMSLNLSDDLRQAIVAGGTPLKLVDSATGETYLLLRESEFSELADTYRAQVESAMRAGWDDPAMDEYNDYDHHNEVEALGPAQISNARLIQIAKDHPPPSEWFAGDEEELF